MKHRKRPNTDALREMKILTPTDYCPLGGASGCRDCAKTDSLARLKKLLPPGTTVYTIVRKVSRSGMSRHIDLYTIKRNRPYYLTGLVANAMGMTRKDDGLHVVGCGMDMGFHIVMNLSYTLHGMKNKGSAEGHRLHTSPRPGCYVAGYSLKQEWL